MDAVKKLAPNTQRPAVKSYVLRQGRMTGGQTRAIELGWPTYGLSSTEGNLDFETIFGRSAPTVLEVGFGMGDALVEQAKQSPEKNFIGVEVHKPGVGHLLLKTLETDLSNLRVFNEDICEVLSKSIPDKSLHTAQVFFPDPWPKKRHHKRRLLRPIFLDLIANKLKPGGVFHIATDWAPYAEKVETLFTERSDFEPSEIPERFETKFERRGLRLGHEIRDLAYRLHKQ